MSTTIKPILNTNAFCVGYTSYRVKAILKPEYVDMVRTFTKEHQWCEDTAPQCIKDWHFFQNANGTCKEMEIDDGQTKTVYDNRIPLGLPSPWWGSECIVYEGIDETTNEEITWWSFSGEMKNTHGEIEYFLQHVLTHIAVSIPLCWTCHETASVFVEHTEDSIRSGKMKIPI